MPLSGYRHFDDGRGAQGEQGSHLAERCFAGETRAVSKGLNRAERAASSAASQDFHSALQALIDSCEQLSTQRGISSMSSAKSSQ